MQKAVNTETALHNLEKFTNYSIRILAYTIVGDGVKSLPIYCHTAEDREYFFYTLVLRGTTQQRSI